MGVWSRCEDARLGRADLDTRGPCAQSQGPRLRHPPQSPGGDHGTIRVREEQPRLRYALRGGSAALRREPEPVGASVPGADGAPGGRVRDRPQPGDRDRATDDDRASPLHGRHGFGGLRPPAHPLRDARSSALPALWRSDCGPERRRDGREPDAPGRRSGCGGGGAGRPRQERRLPQGAGGGPGPRAATRPDRRPPREPSGATATRPASRAPHRRARRSPGPPPRGRRAPAGESRESPRPHGRNRPGLGRGPGRAAAQP